MNKKCILLLSGGFDSPVAGYFLQKSGYSVIPLHISNVQYAGAESIEKSKRIAKCLGFSKLYIADMAELATEIVTHAKHAYYFILIKRLFLRIANEIANKENASYIAMGDSLGQVGSQTVANIHTIQASSERRVLTPLIALDKSEIIELSKKIGTYEISVGPETCDLLGPKHPVTRSDPERATKEERKIKQYEELFNKMVREIKEITLSE